MYRTFNCGVGMLVALPAAEADKAIALLNEQGEKRPEKSVTSRHPMPNNAWSLNEKNIVVLISGNGSNLQAIIDACARKQINGTLRAVFSNKAEAFGLERAREAGIPAFALSPKAFDSREAFDRELMQQIDVFQPDLVVLAGYMRILSPAFVGHYQGRLLNIHPSLLPKYPWAAYSSPGAGKTVMRSMAPRCISSPTSSTVDR